MCSISVEPMPSSTSQPKRAANRSPTSFGSASPADTHSRNATSPRAGNSVAASIAAYSVGTPKKIVGLRSMSRLNTDCGVGRSAIRMVVAPTESGNVSPLPRPYAKNSFAAENTTSSSRIPSTDRP